MHDDDCDSVVHPVVARIINSVQLIVLHTLQQN